MPRISAKARILEYLEHVIRRRMHKARRRFLLGEEDIFEDIKDMLIKNRYLKLQKKDMLFVPTPIVNVRMHLIGTMYFRKTAKLIAMMSFCLYSE